MNKFEYLDKKISPDKEKYLTQKNHEIYRKLISWNRPKAKWWQEIWFFFSPKAEKKFYSEYRRKGFDYLKSHNFVFPRKRKWKKPRFSIFSDTWQARKYRNLLSWQGYFKRKYDTPVYRKHTRIW